MLPMEPPTTATDSDIADALCDKLLRKFFPLVQNWRDNVQRDCVVASVRHHNIIAQLPTDYGKTLLCLIPAVALGGVTVFVAPTLSLVDDLLDTCRISHVPAFRLTGSSAYNEQRLAAQAVTLMQGGILIVTPEMASSRRFAKMLHGLVVRRFVIDEAHSILDCGSWRPAYRTMPVWLGNFICAGAAVTFMPATMTPPLRERLCVIAGTDLADFHHAFRPVSRPNLGITVMRRPGSRVAFAEAVLCRCRVMQMNERAIVFCRSTRSAEAFSERFNELQPSDAVEGAPSAVPSLSAVVYNGKLTIEKKRSAMADWRAGSNNIRVLVATDAASVGIDFPTVAVLEKYDLPLSCSSFL